jgi:hypothetical protein
MLRLFVGVSFVGRFVFQLVFRRKKQIRFLQSTVENKRIFQNGSTDFLKLANSTQLTWTVFCARLRKLPTHKMENKY